jgi:hypothetical protein
MSPVKPAIALVKKELTTGISSAIKLKHIRSYILLEAISSRYVSFLGKGLMKGG